MTAALTYKNGKGVLMQRKYVHVPTHAELHAIPPTTRPGDQLEIPAVFVTGTPGRVPPIYTDGWRQERFDIASHVVTLVRP
jgi:hypothetical protein